MPILRGFNRRLHPPVHRLSVIAIDCHEKLKRLDARRDLKALAICYWFIFHLGESSGYIGLSKTTEMLLRSHISSSPLAWRNSVG